MKTSKPVVEVLSTDADTQALGQRLARVVRPGDVIFLRGKLGAGKTTLVRGFLREMGHVGTVKSPTYTLVEPYEYNNLLIYHFDLYRFSGPIDFISAGFEDYFTESSICLLEWPEHAETLLQSPDFDIQLSHIDNHRQVTIGLPADRQAI